MCAHYWTWPSPQRERGGAQDNRDLRMINILLVWAQHKQGLVNINMRVDELATSLARSIARLDRTQCTPSPLLPSITRLTHILADELFKLIALALVY